MWYQLAADLVLVFHLAFIAFALFGGLPVLRWPGVMWLHLPAAGWAVFIELSGGICPLTPLEHSLRTSAGQQGIEGDFVSHYLLPIIYPSGLTHEIQIVIGLGVVLINAAIYAVVWRRARRRRHRTARPAA